MQMAAAALSLLFLALCPFAAAGGNSKALPLYEINLDLDPSQRYVALFDTSVYPDFNATVWKFYEESFADNAALTARSEELLAEQLAPSRTRGAASPCGTRGGARSARAVSV